ncbi:glycosyltransferase family 2 protein [Bifidobacterium vespertilionis]|uniref:glycosyltransferase family 2 protein n=1 Tax=Bifidobacterium vespertilionis TaxID=2562524 RepID=UPI001BDCCAF6|nr:glycosyltransferase family 2 protein [Bifidobacterium vespertilionis]MBT1179926.1 glycosyltransferase family 2 protein [Bifidobacterium vespertilionis]
MDSLVSVIVPVYNVKPYLQHCVDTLLAQTYPAIEIILVDDGSTDGSGELCEDLGKFDSRIRVLHKQNAGLGMARNTGLDAAKGEYVMFVDSDDFVSPHMVKRLYEQMVRNDADTSYCGYVEYFDDDHMIQKPSAYDCKVFHGDAIIHDVLLNMVASEPSAVEEIPLSVSVWHALYSMHIINKYAIRFPSERQYISEDIVFNIAYLQRSQCVCYIKDCLYYYRQGRSGSLTQRYDADGLAKQKVLFQKIVDDLGLILQPEQYMLRVQRMFLGRVRYCITLAVNYRKNHADFPLYATVRSMVNDETVRQVITAYPYNRNPIQLRLINWCIAHRWAWVVICLVRLKQMRKYSRF